MNKIKEFLLNSNLIENETSDIALEDADEAWGHAMTVERMDVDQLKRIHEILMRRINPRIAGKIRKVDVMVGGRKCPSPSQLPGLLSGYFHYFNDDIFNPIKSLRVGIAKTNHITFEKIHPFEDGNGRVGRILYNWQRLKYGLKIHVIHPGPEQYEYYKWFH